MINAGIDFSSVSRMSHNRGGQDAIKVEDMVSKGIIDPVLVVKNSLRYGASLASILLTADCAVLHDDSGGAKMIVEHEELHI